MISHFSEFVDLIILNFNSSNYSFIFNKSWIYSL